MDEAAVTLVWNQFTKIKTTQKGTKQTEKDKKKDTKWTKQTEKDTKQRKR